MHTTFWRTTLHNSKNVTWQQKKWLSSCSMLLEKVKRKYLISKIADFWNSFILGELLVLFCWISTWNRQFFSTRCWIWDMFSHNFLQTFEFLEQNKITHCQVTSQLFLDGNTKCCCSIRQEWTRVENKPNLFSEFHWNRACLSRTWCWRPLQSSYSSA